MLLTLFVGGTAILSGHARVARPARRAGLLHCGVFDEARAPDMPFDPDIACTLSSFEARALLALREGAPSTGAHSVAGPHSIDLGVRHASSLLVLPDGVALEEASAAPCVSWAELERIAKREGAWKCYHGHLGYAPDRVEGYSEMTRRAASLLPLDGVEATVVLGGFGMHRFAKGVHPGMDTAEKLRALQARGDVLDCCTGLGYTAIGAARSERVRSVTTIELDPLMLQMQRDNPWSAALFSEPKITRLLGDATALVRRLPADAFDCAVHDPPAQAMAGELYSVAFYAALRRALRPNAVLYHYIGDPASKASGKLFRGVKERLLQAGFLQAKTDRAAYGVVATGKST